MRLPIKLWECRLRANSKTFSPRFYGIHCISSNKTSSVEETPEMEIQRQVAEAVAGQFTPDGVVVKALEWALKKEVSLFVVVKASESSGRFMSRLWGGRSRRGLVKFVVVNVKHWALKEFSF